MALPTSLYYAEWEKRLSIQNTDALSHCLASHTDINVPSGAVWDTLASQQTECKEALTLIAASSAKPVLENSWQKIFRMIL